MTTLCFAEASTCSISAALPKQILQPPLAVNGHSSQLKTAQPSAVMGWEARIGNEEPEGGSQSSAWHSTSLKRPFPTTPQLEATRPTAQEVACKRCLPRCLTPWLPLCLGPWLICTRCLTG